MTPEVEPLQRSAVRERGRARAAGGERSEAPSRVHARASSQTESSSSSQRAASPRNAWSRFHGFRAHRSTGCRRRCTASFRSTRIAACTELPTSSPPGDITSFTVKQGGIATQQADVAAEAIAAEAGASVKPKALPPVLRGLLLTGRQPRYLRRELSVQPEHEPVASYEPLWWPPARSSATTWHRSSHRWPVPSPPRPRRSRLRSGPLEWSSIPRSSTSSGRASWPVDDAGWHDRRRRAHVPDPVVVAPEDTLGEVAERCSHAAQRRPQSRSTAG